MPDQFHNESTQPTNSAVSLAGAAAGLSGTSAPLRSAARRRVVLASYPGIMLLDLAGPAQVFEAASGSGPRAYDIIITSMAGGPVATDLGITVGTMPCQSLMPLRQDTLIVLGGPGAWAAAEDLAFLAWIRGFAAGAGRVASVCLGAVVLAATGMLDARRATTHWDHCDRLQHSFPKVQVQRNPIFVQDGTIWTSAGVTAGIDLALAMVEEDLGRATSVAVAQRLVVFLKRPGSQAQRSAVLLAQSKGRDGKFVELQAWMADNIASDLRVERLAGRAGMIPRTFARYFTHHAGQTPAKAVEAMRVEAARCLLASGTDPVGVISLRCGFGDDERMRRAFLRHLGIGPADYRTQFGGPPRLPVMT